MGNPSASQCSLTAPPSGTATSLLLFLSSMRGGMTTCRCATWLFTGVEFTWVVQFLLQFHYDYTIIV